MNIQFSDYKRFFTSIGIALITLAIILPWLVLKEPLLVSMKASEIPELTTIGQYNVWLRQFMSLSLTLISCCTSPFLFIGGAILLTFSLPTWIVAETIEQKLENDIRKLELKSMKNKDMQLAAERELLLQSHIKSKISECFPKEVCVIQETGKSDLVERYDFALHFPSGKSPDILVKIIYTRANPNIKLIEKYFRLFISELAKMKKKSLASRAVIIIMHEKTKNNADTLFDFLKRPDVILQDISESEVEQISCEKLVRLFFPAEMYPVLPLE